MIREVPIDVATEIFTRINEGGKPLSVFEIMVAKTFDVERHFDLAEAYDKLIKKLERVDYETVSDATVLRTVSVILTKECSKKVILNLNKSNFIDIWHEAVDAIERAVDYFRNYFKIPVSKLLPYNDLIVLFAYFFFNHNSRPLDDKERFLKDLFWRISLTERYSAGTEAKIAQDIKRVDMILENDLPEYNYSPYSKMTPEGIEQNGVFSVGRSYIKAILCILAEQQPKSFADNSIVRISNDWLKQANSRNYHHFFPKSFLKKEGIENSKINHIANITIVDEFLNKRIIGSKRPSEYIKTFSRNTMLEETMGSHLIDINLFGVLTDEYDIFFNQRIKTISNMLKEKIIPQTIDQINELLSTSDPNAINDIISKLKLRIDIDKGATIQGLPEGMMEDICTTDEPAAFVESDIQIDLITVTKNRYSGNYSIYIEGNSDGNDTIINPDGKIIPFDADLFEDIEEGEQQIFLSGNLINEVQLKKYKKHRELERYSNELTTTGQLTSTSNKYNKGERLIINTPKNGVLAFGYVSDNNNFKVLKDSTISKVTAPMFKTSARRAFELRESFMGDGTINSNRQFTRDVVFNSISQAASVILGDSKNGNKEWCKEHDNR